MPNWEDFEINCTEYLNRKFQSYAKFERKGGSDSTVPDIKVVTIKGKQCYIEAKYSPAQCGQFVLLPNINTKVFDYSEGNEHARNVYSSAIIDHMNLDFDAFRDAGTAGKEINMPNGPQIFANWIIQSYREKGARYFISNNYTILPIERFADYFTVSAKYRIKRSGSSNVGSSKVDAVVQAVKDLQMENVVPYGTKDRVFATSTKDIHNKRFVHDGYEYMFSKRGAEYEVRKLSNTYNANVIFSIVKNDSVLGLSDKDFIDSLMLL